MDPTSLPEQPQQQQHQNHDYTSQPSELHVYGQNQPSYHQSQLQQYPYDQTMNPAAAVAVAALSQLVHFAGNMGAVERAVWQGNPELFLNYGAMQQLVSQHPFRGGGRRGGRSFRGGGRGNFSRPFRGRGRGRGRSGMRFDQSHGAPSSVNGDSSVSGDAEPTKEKAEPTVVPEGANAVVVPTETLPSTSVPGKKAPNRPSAQAARCELCNVDCNSLEILEQHKNGKKHKKNLQRMGELKNANKLESVTVEQNLVAKCSRGVASKDSQDGGENNPTAHLPIGGIVEENKMQTVQDNSTTEQPTEVFDLQAGNPGIDEFENRRCGMKRKLRGGRGGKRMRTFEASKLQPVEPPKPKVVIPLFCDLCNVKCDTQEVLNKHLAGKKHNSKLKRFQGHQAMYGHMVQALYPPNPIAQNLYNPQGHQQDFYGPQGSYPYPQPEAYIAPQDNQAAALANSSNTLYQQDPQPQLSESSSAVSVQNTITGLPETQQQTETTMSQTQ